MSKLWHMKLTIKEKQAVWLTIGQNVIAARKKRKVSQEVLAQKAGFSVVFIGMIERGQRAAPTATLMAIARALGIKVTNLVKGL